MIEINLIPDVKQELIRAQRARSIVVSSSILAGIIALGIVALLAVYIYGVQTLRSTLADDAIRTGSEELASIEDLPEVLTIQNQLAQIDQLNTSKKEESRVFDMLAAVIPPSPNDVQVSQLSFDAETNSMIIAGQTESYDALEVFKKTIDGAVVTYTVDGEEQTEKLAEEISLTNVAFGEDANGAPILQFTISFVYPESLFAASIPNIVIKLTNAGNVTDSFLGIPKNIFVTGGGDE